MRVFDFDSAIVRLPGASVVRGLRAGGGPDPDLHAFQREHTQYIAALEAAGLQVSVLEPLEAFADSVFVEDPALVFPEGAVLLNLGADSRRGEAAALKPALEARFGQVLALEAGFADGGDALVTPQTVYIGLSHRTDAAGAADLKRKLAMLGRDARVVETPDGVLHFKSASTLIDHETVLTIPALAGSDVFKGLRTLIVPPGEDAAACVLRVNDVVLAAAQFPRTLDLLAAHGLDVIPVPATEVVKLDAGLTCMSLRWKTG
ncbi:MAG TPA: arginine deiminase family protein [Caulobacteraceae bacterium]|jgi:dimethylargininase